MSESRAWMRIPLIKGIFSFGGMFFQSDRYADICTHIVMHIVSFTIV